MQQCTAGERNSEIFQNQYKPWEEIVVMITRDTGKRFLSWRDAVDDAPKSREFLDSWQILVQFTVPSPTWCSWRPPDPDMWCLNTHGSLRGDLAGYGCILRDHAGQPKVAISARCPPFSILVHERRVNSRGPSWGDAHAIWQPVRILDHRNYQTTGTLPIERAPSSRCHLISPRSG